MIESSDELILRERMSVNAAALPSMASIAVNPAPLLVNGTAEFWATFDPSKATKDDIDESLIAALWIYPVRYDKDFTSGGADSPLIKIVYEHFLFVQYGYIRVDETDTPTLFGSQRLVQHDKFVAGWIELMQLYEGDVNIDPAGFEIGKFSSLKTSSMEQLDDIQNLAPCEFVSGIVGFSVKLRETVKALLTAC